MDYLSTLLSSMYAFKKESAFICAKIESMILSILASNVQTSPDFTLYDKASGQNTLYSL